MKVLFGFGLTAFGLAASSASAALVVDNFESYTPGQAIGSSATSTPWLRFGAVADNFFASNNSTSLLDGALSGRIPVAIATGATSATLRRNFVTATDLSASLNGTATVLTESLAATPTTTVQLSVSDGTTTYLSTVGLAETATAQTLTFSLAPAAFTVAAGSTPFATVLATASSIGFRVASTATAASETLAFDDFTLNDATTGTPEPAAAGVLCVGVAALGRRRRAC